MTLEQAATSAHRDGAIAARPSWAAGDRLIVLGDLECCVLWRIPSTGQQSFSLTQEDHDATDWQIKALVD